MNLLGEIYRLLFPSHFFDFLAKPEAAHNFQVATLLHVSLCSSEHFL